MPLRFDKFIMPTAPVPMRNGDSKRCFDRVERQRHYCILFSVDLITPVGKIDNSVSQI